ncbi:flagellar basal body protein FliL [Amycolatopsis sp. GM8]|uniref:flagellar basal body protein FliL n=1 Tax=Amycolatopsis sp. GM8 TaxID=2896530 RepID=UPI001F441479|nr:flagellar basal body protein FliL [Amycolatopsis sp. GM8]
MSTPGWQQPYQPPQQPWYGYPPGYPPPPPPRRRRRGLIIGLVIALVAAVGGGTTWYLLAKRATGAATPTAAALNLASSISNGDLVGVLDSLAPAEAALFTDPVQDTTKELKRLRVLDENADPNALNGVQIKSEHLTFDEAGAEQVNDHLTITKLTGGTLTVTSDFSRLPVGKKFLDEALPGSARPQGPQTEMIDIAKEVRKTGEPVRIATVRVDGEWYPSLLYTIADYALKDAHEPWPSTSIPAAGASSAKEAVQQMVQAALDADLRRVIELLPPDEMAVLHDVGPAILQAAQGETEPSGARVTDFQAQTSAVTGGTRVTLTAVRVEDGDGRVFAAQKMGDCYEVTDEDSSQRMCADDLIDRIGDDAGSVPSDVREVLRHLATGILHQGVGVVTTETGGKYYVSPIRTLTEQGMTVLRSLQPGDIDTLLKFAR